MTAYNNHGLDSHKLWEWKQPSLKDPSDGRDVVSYEG